MNGIGMKYKNLKRYKKIGEVLAKYGFTFVTDRLIEKGYIPKLILRVKPMKSSMSDGEKLRRACEELGPTFIKLGQIMSTRRDIFSKEITEELSKLQDNVKPFPFTLAEDIFENEMQRSLVDCFKEFDTTPIASASIGQVYKGTLKTGEKVVVKIQRPLIKEIIERDLYILNDIAKLLDEHMDREKPYKLMEIVDEFSYVLKKELDYSLEGKNAEKFYENFKGDSNVVIPRVYWDFSSKRVLTLQRIYGIKIMDTDSMRKNKWNLQELATISADCFAKQVFKFGFFHGDPHPGNIFVVDSNKIAFVDFGIVGFLDKGTMRLITNLFTAATRKDVERIISILIEIEALNPGTNIRRLKEDISFIINFYYNMPLNKLNLGDTLRRIMDVAYVHKLKLPSQFIILLKSVIIFEGSVKSLNPEVSLSNIAKKFTKDIYFNKLNPRNLAIEFKDYSEEVLYGIKYLPKQIKRLIRKLENSQLKLKFDKNGIDKLEGIIYRSTNQLSLSMILSSLIMGFAIIFSNINQLDYNKLLIFALIGFLLTSIFGILIILSILFKSIRKKKND